MENEEYLVVAEVAKPLRISGQTVRNFIREGRFPGAIKVGRKMLIPRREVEALIQASKQEQRAA